MGFKIHKLSKIFRPLTGTSTYAEGLGKSSNSHKLMINLGLIHHNGNGFYTLLPLAQRSYDKLLNLVDYHMDNLGAQKMCLPILTNLKLWEKTGTFGGANEETFVVKDRSRNNFILSPTHEASFTNLLSAAPMSYRHFPLLLYQVTSKFRDEASPKHGLIRTKEFIMKDLYSFHTSMESAKETYDNVLLTYKNIFDSLEIEYHKVLAVSEVPKIYESHEFHYVCSAGDDKILVCSNCNYSANYEVLPDKKLCPKCSSSFNVLTGLEVGHTFSFGQWYSNSLNAFCFNKDHKKNDLFMCSYGIGLTRLIAAALECKSTDLFLRWPLRIVPYTLCIIPPKEGSKEEHATSGVMDDLIKSIADIDVFKNDVIVDDRIGLTIGKRMLEVNALGFPFVVVIGREATKETPIFEVNDVYNTEKLFLPKEALLQYLKDNVKRQFTSAQYV